MNTRKYFALLAGIIIISAICFAFSIYNFRQSYITNKHYTPLAQKAPKGDINAQSELLKEGHYVQMEYKDRSINYAIAAIFIPAIFFGICYAVLYYPVIKRSGKSFQLVKIQETNVSPILGKSVRFYLLILFYVACVFFILVPVLIVLYIIIFPPVTGRMITAFLTVVILIIVALFTTSYILLKRGKKHIALGVMITNFILMFVGIPQFIAENNHQLSHTQFIDGSVPDYMVLSIPVYSLILFSCEFYNFIGDKSLPYAIAYLFIFLGVRYYLRRRKRRVKHVGN